MVKTFTATAAYVSGDPKKIASWHLSAGGTACIVNFCNGTSATPIFQVQVPINTSASQSYPKPMHFPAGLHVELVSGVLNRGTVDLI